MRTAIAVLATISAGSAHADWQYTRWGMDVPEVVAASNNVARPINDAGKNGDGFKTLLMAPYEALDQKFTAYFRFDDATGKLVLVEMVPTRKDKCPELVFALNKAYGPTQDKYRGAVSRVDKWWDRTNGNLVAYSEIGPDCSIRYEPLSQGGAKGGL